MTGKTQPSEEEIASLASLIVESMSLEQMEQFIFDDLVHIMSEDTETYYSNLDFYGY